MSGKNSELENCYEKKVTGFLLKYILFTTEVRGTFDLAVSPCARQQGGPLVNFSGRNITFATRRFLKPKFFSKRRGVFRFGYGPHLLLASLFKAVF